MQPTCPIGSMLAQISMNTSKYSPQNQIPETFLKQEGLGSE